MISQLHGHRHALWEDQSCFILYLVVNGGEKRKEEKEVGKNEKEEKQEEEGRGRRMGKKKEWQGTILEQVD